MIDSVSRMLRSKKFIAAVLATILGMTAHVVFKVPTGDIAPLILPLLTFVLGQGIADVGKEAERIRNNITE